MLKQADYLQKRLALRRWYSRSFARLEQAVMLGFYSIRKLVEAHKVSDKVSRMNVPLLVYPRNNRRETVWNKYSFEELYDLDKGKHQSRSLMFVCNQVIHSWVLIWDFQHSKELKGILVSSDRERHKVLHSISMDEIVRIFELVGNNYPKHFMMTGDQDPDKVTYIID